jgi:hypothetical protein
VAEEKKRIVYLAATPSDAAKGIFKVGETDDVDRRMAELSGTSHHEKYITYKTWIDCPISDKRIHKILKEKGIRRIDSGREFFDFGTTEDATREINEAIVGTRKLHNYQEREEQTRIIEEVCRNFTKISDTKKMHLIDAKMRAGKCHITYKVALRMGFRRVLIISSKPSGVLSSWAADIDHVSFGDFDFSSAQEIDDVCFRDAEEDTTQIVFVSSQDCVGNDGNKEKFHKLFTQSFDMLVIDECHHGADTEKVNDFLYRLDYDHELHLSGTAFKAKRSGKFGLDQISTWTYVDEQKKRREEEESGWKTALYRALPTFSVYIATYNDKVIETFRKQYHEEEMPTCFKMFSNDKCIKDFLDWVIIDRHMGDKVTCHMFWLLPGIDHCNKMEKALTRHPKWSQYTVVNASGNSVTDLTDTKNGVYNHQSKTITLSCGRWNTGSTVPQWDSVWLLDDGYSPEVYFQTIFRAGSPHVKNGEYMKEHVHFVDFNSDRSLEAFYEYASCYAKGNSTVVSMVRSLLDCMPLYRVNALEVKPLKYEDLSEHFNSQKSFNPFGTSSLLDVAKLDDVTKQILQEVEKSRFPNNRKDLNPDSEGRGKNHQTVQIAGNSTTTNSKVDDYDWNEKLKTTMRKFASLLFALDTTIIRDVRELENHTGEFQRHVGMSYHDFIKFLDGGSVKEEELNMSIDRFNRGNEFLFS